MSDPFEEFGPYLVYERLGQGGMATVHRAEKRGTGIRKPIALKRLLPHVAADPDLVKLFVDEARLASHLHHANVAQTYELGRVDDIYFIAMEYASGPTLTQVVRQCQVIAGSIPPPITVNILSQICEALDYAHNLCDDRGEPLRMIHRDVSPGNIIVTHTGLVKLIDFGIAKATISSTKTQAGFIKGKFGYIAPEYISGKIDKRVDLFAVGVVAHEMLAGRRLFEGADDFETLQNIRDMKMSPPSEYNGEVAPDLDHIVMTALARDPDERWQSAAAMQAALATVVRGFGRVIGGPQIAEWIDWAFRQAPYDSGPVAQPSEAAARPLRESSVSIDLRDSLRDSLPSMPEPPLSASEFALEQVDMTLRELGIATPGPQRGRSARAETVLPQPVTESQVIEIEPVRFEPARAELVRPEPARAAPSVAPHSVISDDPGDSQDAAPTRLRLFSEGESAIDGVALHDAEPPLHMFAPPTLDAEAPAAPRDPAQGTPAPEVAVEPPRPAHPPPSLSRAASAVPVAPTAPTAPTKRQPTAPATRGETEAGGGRRVVWGILLILALGVAAMAIAYYWPSGL